MTVVAEPTTSVSPQTTEQATAPHTQVLNVTPELAARWLATVNPSNRQIRPAHVEKLARDIRMGQWQLTHQGIAFSRDHLLLDGQHRLKAIVQAGLTVQMNVTFNMTPGALIAIDKNVIRSDADALNLTGMCGRVTEEQMATLRAMLCGLRGIAVLTPADMQQAMLRHKNVIEFAHQQLPKGARRRGIAHRIPRAVVARAWYSADLERLMQFCAVLRTGIASHPDDQPAAMLYTYLINSSGSSLAQLRDRYTKTEQALSSFMLMDQLPRLRSANRELFAIPEDTQR